MTDPIDIDHIPTDDPHWLDWDDIKAMPADPPPSMPPLRAPEILRHCEQIGADPTTFGQLDPADEQAMRTQALLTVADRLAELAKELSRLAEEVRANA